MEPHSPLYKFIISGQLEYEGLLTREISGQEEGSYGRNLLLERTFFSPKYGITDYCQYHTTVLDRLNEYLHSEKNKQKAFSSPAFMERCGHSLSLASQMKQLDDSIVEIGTSVTNTLDIKTTEVESGTVKNKLEDFPMQVNTGRLWHPLNLVSAYRHRIERLGCRVSEVTTHHNRARCTVDYIFYTVDSKETRVNGEKMRVSHIRDGSLRLIGRYGLLSADELARLGGIPSSTLPSDHLCLITKFLLL